MPAAPWSADPVSGRVLDGAETLARIGIDGGSDA
jgi:hypothetical protein